MPRRRRQPGWALQQGRPTSRIRGRDPPRPGSSSQPGRNLRAAGPAYPPRQAAAPPQFRRLCDLARAPPDVGSRQCPARSGRIRDAAGAPAGTVAPSRAPAPAGYSRRCAHGLGEQRMRRARASHATRGPPPASPRRPWPCRGRARGRALIIRGCLRWRWLRRSSCTVRQRAWAAAAHHEPVRRVSWPRFGVPNRQLAQSSRETASRLARA